jgi:hypothetical protein
MKIKLSKERNAILFIIGFAILFSFLFLGTRRNSIFESFSNTSNTSNTNEQFDIKVFDNFLTPEQCDYIIEKAKPNLNRSEVMGNKKREIAENRTSSHVFLDQQNDKVLNQIAKKISNINGYSIKNQEKIQVVHYNPGEKYDHHFDACENKTPFCERDKKRGGQRHNTFFVYLNDVEEGGETDFPKINKKVKPKKGSAVYWRNLEDDENTPHPKSFHAGLAPISGEKWGMNIWTRCGSFV